MDESSLRLKEIRRLADYIVKNCINRNDPAVKLALDVIDFDLWILHGGQLPHDWLVALKGREAL